MRGRDERGKEFLEFATALNISSGGALVAVGRAVVRASSLSLEIPSTPLDNLPGLPAAARRLRGRVVHVQPSPRCHLLGVKFSRPLLRPPQRKLSSPQ